MSQITIHQLNYSIGSTVILNNISWTLVAGKKYGLVGNNGSGKTTLIRHIMGELESADGKVRIAQGLHLGYVPQYLPKDDRPVLEYLLEAAKAKANLLSQTEEALQIATEESLPGLLEEYRLRLEAFEKNGGYTAAETAQEILGRLGFENSPEQTVNTLSGGEQSLVLLAKALIGNPDFLILDEPGNHLDFLGLAWLEKFLSSWPGTVLVVSHNRYFLDRVCGEIGEMSGGKLSVYAGNYSQFRLEKDREALINQNRFLQDQRTAVELKKKIAELQGISQSMYNPPPRVSAELGAAQKKLAALVEGMCERPKREDSGFVWDIDTEKSKSDFALRIDGFPLCIGERVLIDQVDLEICTGERVALVGANGTGKTTLLKRIIDNQKQQESQIRTGQSQRIGFVSQHPVFNREEGCIEDEVRSWGPLSRDDAFRLISGFHFTYSDLDKPLSVLSGGEKNRLQLAKVAYQGANFLILDEPTNHMDIDACESIEEALVSFPGTILVVSHDRYFLDKIVNRVIELTNKKLESYKGNFTQFFRNKYPVLPNMKGSAANRRKEREVAGKAVTLDADIHILEIKITEAETRREFLEKRLAQAYENNDLKRGKEISSELEKLAVKIEKLYSELP